MLILHCYLFFIFPPLGPLDSIPNNQRQSLRLTTPSTSSRGPIDLTSVDPPPYAPPKKSDPETIAPCEPSAAVERTMASDESQIRLTQTQTIGPCEPPPPYTPEAVTFV